MDVPGYLPNGVISQKQANLRRSSNFLMFDVYIKHGYRNRSYPFKRGKYFVIFGQFGRRVHEFCHFLFYLFFFTKSLSFLAFQSWYKVNTQIHYSLSDCSMQPYLLQCGHRSDTDSSVPWCHAIPAQTAQLSQVHRNTDIICYHFRICLIILDTTQTWTVLYLQRTFKPNFQPFWVKTFRKSETAHPCMLPTEKGFGTIKGTS